MALNVCNWSDKQLDELVDMLKSADFSAVATFIANNFLCSGSRVMTNDTSTTLRATVGVDTNTIVLSAGTFVHANKCSQLDTDQTINILPGGTGTWGTGQAVTGNRWSIICVKNNEQAHTAANRWFVTDSVVPNTYAQQSTNTLLNKAYYDIVVVHGADGGGVPATPAGYWAIVEIYIPGTAIDLSSAGVLINDTTGTSSSVVGPEAGGKNWVATTRVLRMEFWSTKFSVDHDPATGFHRTEGQGGWHIGADMVKATAVEMNQALDGIGGTVTAANLTKLTNSSTLAPGELHNHTTLSSRVNNIYDAATFVCPAAWADITSMQLSITTTDVSSFVMFYEGQNLSNWTAWVRFLVDGGAINPVDGYGGSPSANPLPIHFHGVSLNLAAGAHIFKVQAIRSQNNGSQLSKNQFTVMVF